MPNIIDKVNINGTSYDIKDSVSGYITGISAADVTNAMGYTPTSNTGTVTSVSLSGGTGISINGSPITTSGTITINHSNSVTAQTTQAVYPIKIDAQGHVSAYGTAVSIPSKVSDLSNDAGYISSETDPTVPSWAKTSEKPTYTPNEVGVHVISYSIEYDDQLEQEIIILDGATYSDIQTWLNNNEVVILDSRSTGKSYYPCGSDRGVLEFGNTDGSKIYIWSNDTGIYQESELATINDIPVDVSELNNDAGYITTETDPTVPSWAKQTNKPTYAASEITVSNYTDWSNVQSAIAGLASDITSLESDKVSISAVGASSGVAPLNASGKIDSTYLPSYVDDVIEGYYYNNKFYKESTHTTEITGETGKIYIDLSTDKVYRYGGTAYAEIAQGSLVSVTRDLNSGTQIGTITINGTGTSLYAPTPPSKVSELSNDSGFITGISAADVSTALGYTPYNSTNPNGYVNAAGASAAAPVQSVNSKTGAVTLSAADVGALPSNTTIPTVTDTYSSSGTDAISGKGVYAAIQTLDSSITATSNQAISAITITDGKITSSSKITLPTVPSDVSAFNNDAGYISGISSSDVTTALGYTPISAETDPVFSASPAAGISAADISSWNDKVSDDHKWNDVELIKSSASFLKTTYIPQLENVTDTSAKLTLAVSLPSSFAIAKYDDNAYLNSTTPASSDNSTKVATTAFVKGAIPSNVSAFSNDVGYITGITSTDVTTALGFTPTSNTGTVTSVAASAGTGISISGSPITSSGTITIGHSNSVTAQTTQAVYPIKIDAQGHISDYGAAVTIPTPYNSSTNPSGYLRLSDLPIYDGTVTTYAEGVSF